MNNTFEVPRGKDMQEVMEMASQLLKAGLKYVCAVQPGENGPERVFVFQEDSSGKGLVTIMVRQDSA